MSRERRNYERERFERDVVLALSARVPGCMVTTSMPKDGERGPLLYVTIFRPDRAGLRYYIDGTITAEAETPELSREIAGKAVEALEEVRDLFDNMGITPAYEGGLYRESTSAPVWINAEANATGRRVRKSKVSRYLMTGRKGS